MIGIIGYGAYVPKYRIRSSDIAAVWKKEAKDIQRSLAVFEKSVPARDEDAVTLAIEAATRALSMAKKEASVIETLLVGSESHPYAVNPTSTIVGELLGAGNNYLAADLEFACKAGSAGMQLIAGLLQSNHISYGMAIGSDTAQSRPHDALEYAAASASAAFLFGNKKSEIIAQLLDFSSYSSDTPDFWRRDGMRYPSHSGRFTGEPAYFAHVMGAAQQLLQKTKMKPTDFDHCIFHMPNGKFPVSVARKLGFSSEQLKHSLTVRKIGNPYSASSLVGLVSVLEAAKPKQKIFMVSYGSGAGSDAFVFETTEVITTRKSLNFAKMIEDKEYLDYVEYLKRMKII